MKLRLYCRRWALLLVLLIGAMPKDSWAVDLNKKTEIGGAVAAAIVLGSAMGVASVMFKNQDSPKIRSDLLQDLNKKLTDYKIKGKDGKPVTAEDLFREHGWDPVYDSPYYDSTERTSANKFKKALGPVMEEAAQLRAEQVGERYGFRKGEVKDLRTAAMDNVRYQLPPKGTVAVKESKITAASVQQLETSAFDELDGFQRIVNRITMHSQNGAIRARDGIFVDEKKIARALLKIAKEERSGISFSLEDGETSPTDIYLDKLVVATKNKLRAAQQELRREGATTEERATALREIDEAVPDFMGYRRAQLERTMVREGVEGSKEKRAFLKSHLIESFPDIGPQIARVEFHILLQSENVSQRDVKKFWEKMLRNSEITEDNFPELVEELNQRFSETKYDYLFNDLMDLVEARGIIEESDVSDWTKKRTKMQREREPGHAEEGRRAGASARSRNMESDEFAAEAEVAGEDTETVLPSSPSDTAGAVGSEVGSGRSGTHSEGERVGSAGRRGDDTLGAGEDDTSDRERKAQETREEHEREQQQEQQQESGDTLRDEGEHWG